MRRPALALLVLAAVPLGGCVASIAASAASMAIRSAQPKPVSNAHLKPVAVQACSDQAAPHGTVHVIDVEQRATGRMIVWGTATRGDRRLSFECHFTDVVAAFKLRTVRARG